MAFVSASRGIVHSDKRYIDIVLERTWLEQQQSDLMGRQTGVGVDVADPFQGTSPLGLSGLGRVW